MSPEVKRLITEKPFVCPACHRRWRTEPRGGKCPGHGQRGVKVWDQSDLVDT